MRIDAAEINMHNAAQVVAAGIEAIRAGDATFDLSGVRNCDSSAVAVALAWQREADARGLPLRLGAVPPGLLSLATVYGVAPLLSLGQDA